MEPKQVGKTASKSKPAPKQTVTGKVLTKLKPVRVKIDNIIKKVKKPKKAKKTTKKEQYLARLQKIRGIIGIGLLFVVVSIAYSTYMTVLFVDGTMMVVALAPQVIFALATLVIAFYKLYK